MNSAVRTFFDYLSECANWLYNMIYEFNMSLLNHNQYMQNVIFIYCLYIFIIAPLAVEVFLSMFFSFKTKRLVFFSPKYISTLRKNTNVSLYRASAFKPNNIKPLSSSAILVTNKGGLNENIKANTFGSRVISPLSESIKSDSLSPKTSGSLTGSVTESIKGSAISSKNTGSVHNNITGSVTESIKGSAISSKNTGSVHNNITGSVTESIKGSAISSKNIGSVQNNINGSSFSNKNTDTKLKGSYQNKFKDTNYKEIKQRDTKYKTSRYDDIRYHNALKNLWFKGIRFEKFINWLRSLFHS